MAKGTIVKVSGPLVIAEGMRDANMFDVVKVSEHGLIGEVIENNGNNNGGSNNSGSGDSSGAVRDSQKAHFQVRKT